MSVAGIIEKRGGMRMILIIVEGTAYQKQLPYNLRSDSLEWFLTVTRACPVAFLWYVFLAASPLWLMSVILK